MPANPWSASWREAMERGYGVRRTEASALSRRCAAVAQRFVELIFLPLAFGPELLAGQDRAKRERFRAEQRCSTQIGRDGRSGCGPMRLKMSPR